jgi:hypothetical protein
VIAPPRGYSTSLSSVSSDGFGFKIQNPPTYRSQKRSKTSSERLSVEVQKETPAGISMRKACSFGLLVRGKEASWRASPVVDQSGTFTERHIIGPLNVPKEGQVPCRTSAAPLPSRNPEMVGLEKWELPGDKLEVSFVQL